MDLPDLPIENCDFPYEYLRLFTREWSQIGSTEAPHNIIHPLVMTKIAMETHNFQW